MTPEERREYMRRYRAEHPNYMRQYLYDHPEQRARQRAASVARSRRYRQAHKDEINARRRKRYAESPEYRAMVAKWSKESNARNREKRTAYHREYIRKRKESEVSE